MSETDDRWQRAFDDRERAIRAHPAYATLVHKVARAEAAGIHPGKRRWRDKGIWANRRALDGGYIMHLRWSQFQHPHTDAQGPREAMKDAWRFAESMVPDVFPDPWPARGDMIAAVYGAARTDVTRRRAVRRSA